MKKLSLLLKTVLFSLLFVNTQAQTADDVVNKYIDAIGGKEKLEKLTGIKMEMVANAQGMEIPVEVSNSKDGKLLVKLNLMGKEMTQVAFDGTIGWTTNMMTMKAEKMNSEDIENMKLSAGKDFPDPFLNYKEKGYSIEYAGKETKEGTDCHKIKLTKSPQTVNGQKVDDVSFYYFDAENNVPVLVETEIKEGEMKGQMSTSTFGNYQEVEGIYYPFTLNQFGQEMTIKKITPNPTLDPKEFEFKTE